MKKKHPISFFLVPILLVMVCGVQFVRVNVQYLTPWKGGGFGMFSTIDSTANRHLKIYLLVDGSRFRVQIPDSLDAKAEKVRAMPAPELVEKLAQDLSEMSWIFNASAPLIHSKTKFEPVVVSKQLKLPNPAKIQPEGVEVEVWRGMYQMATQKYVSEKMIKVRVGS